MRIALCRPAPAVAVGSAGDQSSMPRQQRVRRDDGADVRERPPAEILGFRGQPDPLIVGEPHAVRDALLVQGSVLGLEIFDYVALLLMDPASHGNKRNCKGWDTGDMARQPIKQHPDAPHLWCSNAQLHSYFRNLDRVVGQYALQNRCEPVLARSP